LFHKNILKGLAVTINSRKRSTDEKNPLTSFLLGFCVCIVAEVTGNAKEFDKGVIYVDNRSIRCFLKIFINDRKTEGWCLFNRRVMLRKVMR